MGALWIEIAVWGTLKIENLRIEDFFTVVRVLENAFHRSVRFKPHRVLLRSLSIRVTMFRTGIQHSEPKSADGRTWIW